MDAAPELTDEVADAVRRRVRLVALLHTAEEAGIAPLAILRLHTFAYLANVLAPVWDMPALDGKVLKRHGGPFYPALQADLDRLVGMGVVTIIGLKYVRDDAPGDRDERWRLEGSYRLEPAGATRVLEQLLRMPDERATIAFLQELAYALSALSDDEIDRIMTEDATYSDPLVGEDNVVDFAEWSKTNYSANAARAFVDLLPAGSLITSGEKIHLYVRHLRRRMLGGT